MRRQKRSGVRRHAQSAAMAVHRSSPAPMGLGHTLGDRVHGQRDASGWRLDGPGGRTRNLRDGVNLADFRPLTKPSNARISANEKKPAEILACCVGIACKMRSLTTG